MMEGRNSHGTLPHRKDIDLYYITFTAVNWLPIFIELSYSHKEYRMSIGSVKDQYRMTIG
jgi:hypothetical protein